MLYLWKEEPFLHHAGLMIVIVTFNILKEFFIVPQLFLKGELSTTCIDLSPTSPEETNEQALLIDER